MARPRKSAKNENPQYCQHKRSGRGYVTLDGQQRWLPGTFGSDESKGAYDRLIAAWLQAGRTLPMADAGIGPTVTMIALAFWRHAQAYYVKPDGSPSGEAGNYRVALRALKEMFGDTQAGKFGPKSLKMLRQQMTTERDGKDPVSGDAVKLTGWSRTYANRQIKRIQQVFRWAASEELLSPTIPAALDTVDAIRNGGGHVRETAPVQPVSDEVVEATLRHLPPPVKAIVQLQQKTGARGGELFPLRTCDIDMKGEVWKYRPAQHKTAHHGKQRVIRFGPQAQEILRPFLRPDMQAFIFQPADSLTWRADRLKKSKAKCDAPPNIRQVKARYTKDTYARAIARACDIAFPLPPALARQQVSAVKSNGRKFKRWETKPEWRARLGTDGWRALKLWRTNHRWHPHQLRHSSGTAYRRHADFETAKIVLGHSSDSMTQLYAERDERKADEAVARLG
jgi:integrase